MIDFTTTATFILSFVGILIIIYEGKISKKKSLKRAIATLCVTGIIVAAVVFLLPKDTVNEYSSVDGARGIFL